MTSGLISHADKVLFAERGDTKGDLAAHYERVASRRRGRWAAGPCRCSDSLREPGGPSFF